MRSTLLPGAPCQLFKSTDFEQLNSVPKSINEAKVAAVIEAGLGIGLDLAEVTARIEIVTVVETVQSLEVADLRVEGAVRSGGAEIRTR